MARTSEKKYCVAKRALAKTRASKLADYEVFFDPLALPISTGIEEDRLNAKETIKAIEKIRNNFPDIHIKSYFLSDKFLQKHCLRNVPLYLIFV